MSLKELEARLQNVENILAIDRLEKIYGYYMDNHMYEEALDCFSDNAESIEIADRGVFRGKEGVRKFFRDYMGKEGILQQPGTMGFHMQHQGVITPDRDGKTARGRWYLIMIQSRPVEAGGPTRSVLGHGVYENEFVKEDGVWKFKKMFMSLHFRSPIAEGWASTPVVGEGMASQADAPPTAYHPYPHIVGLPFHFRHPVTGK